LEDFHITLEKRGACAFASEDVPMAAATGVASWHAAAEGFIFEEVIGGSFSFSTTPLEGVIYCAVLEGGACGSLPFSTSDGLKAFFPAPSSMADFLQTSYH
jgi:hypothetical protein